MALAGFYPSRAEADAALRDEGFIQRESGYWAKPSKVDDWHGGHACMALVEVRERRVAPEYGGGSYFEPWFL